MNARTAPSFALLSWLVLTSVASGQSHREIASKPNVSGSTEGITLQSPENAPLSETDQVTETIPPGVRSTEPQSVLMPETLPKSKPPALTPPAPSFEQCCDEDGSMLPIGDESRGLPVFGGPTANTMVPAKLTLTSTQPQQGRLHSGDRPSRWATVDYGPLEFTLLIPHVDGESIDAIRFWLNGNMISPSALIKRDESVVIDPHSQQEVLVNTIHYEVSCPPLGRHLLQVTYLRKTQWSPMSAPLRFEVLEPPTPEIIAVAQGKQTPSAHQIRLPIKTNGDVTLKLAGVDPQDRVAVDLDGMEICQVQVDQQCCVAVELAKHVPPGRYRIQVRSIGSQSCDLSSQPSNTAWVQFHTPDRHVSIDTPLDGNKLPVFQTVAPLLPTLPSLESPLQFTSDHIECQKLQQENQTTSADLFDRATVLVGTDESREEAQKKVDAGKEKLRKDREQLNRAVEQLNRNREIQNRRLEIMNRIDENLNREQERVNRLTDQPEGVAQTPAGQPEEPTKWEVDTKLSHDIGERSPAKADPAETVSANLENLENAMKEWIELKQDIDEARIDLFAEHQKLRRVVKQWNCRNCDANVCKFFAQRHKQLNDKLADRDAMLKHLASFLEREGVELLDEVINGLNQIHGVLQVKQPLSIQLPRQKPTTQALDNIASEALRDRYKVFFSKFKHLHQLQALFETREAIQCDCEEKPKCPCSETDALKAAARALAKHGYLHAKSVAEDLEKQLAFVEEIQSEIASLIETYQFAETEVGCNVLAELIDARAIKQQQDVLLEQALQAAVHRETADRAQRDTANKLAKSYWKRREYRKEIREAYLRNAPDTVTYFDSPATFPIPRFGRYGVDDSRQGMMISENMKWVTRANGSYTLQYELRRAEMPAKLSLQLQFQTPGSDIWHTITLPEEIVRPGTAQYRLAEESDLNLLLDENQVWRKINQTGSHPALERSGGRITKVRRKGSAQYGYGFEGLDVYRDYDLVYRQ
ncbi:hypothetical protein [Roseiconus lacunae]|uniref:Uncharacterized protein n=1 Tax=Roseiconus lacunae TaxID=2605694 RepID=A0ABT7PNW7_9BACT|nr:hypothetical protein [Roseiconus lacunae]MDM4017974.1 hypothetical protein [Roseiconus lacunae]